MSIPAHNDTGYIVNFEYPENLHELHVDYPLVPEHLTVSPAVVAQDIIRSTEDSSNML